MKSKIEAILYEIDYQWARLIEPSILYRNWDPETSNPLLWDRKNQASEAKKKIKEIFALLDQVPVRLLELIDSHARTSKDWDEGRSPFNDVLVALLEVQKMTDVEINKKWGGGKVGASKKHHANETANMIARIYVLGMGKMPTSGSRTNGMPSGKFSETVHKIFRIVHPNDNFRKPCDQAVRKLKANDGEEFKNLMYLRETKGRRQSLLTGRLST